MNGHPTLPFNGAPASPPRPIGSPEDIPLIYIASPLTRITSESERRSIVFQVDKIVTTIADRHGGHPLYRTHAPAVLSSPWIATDMSAEDVYRQNTTLILTEADAIIILALNGGSDGTGQELALANQRGIPVLRLSPGDEPISRQITGNPFVDARPYQLPDELAAAVTQFLVNNKTALLDGPRWRRSKTIIYSTLQSNLLTAWRAMSSPTRRGKAAAGAQLTPAFLDHSLGHPLLVATIPHHQLLAVGTELGIDVASYFTSPADPLTIAQTDALLVARDEYGWTDDQAQWLVGIGRQELARGGVRRLLLNSPADWLRLMDTYST